MTNTATPISDIAGISDWAGSPISTVHRLAGRPQPIRVEQYPDGGAYVIRFELPAIEPARDLQVTVQVGVLSVRAERRDEPPVKQDSEFAYGEFARHVSLPLGANVQNVTATYHNGILAVRIGMEPEHQAAPQAIPVEAV
jgi:HSP20 family protein